MKKYKLTWDNGKEFEFDAIDIHENVLIYFYQSDDILQHLNVSVYAKLRDRDNLYRQDHLISVGVIRSTSKALPFPAGTYLPFRGPKLLLKGLTGDLIIHDNFKKKSTN